MQTTTTKTESRVVQGIVYSTQCQNPGCGHVYDLRITPQEVSLLSGPIACPRCRRRGGMLKPAGRLGDKLFAAKLVYRMTGVAPASSGPAEGGDLVTDITG